MTVRKYWQRHQIQMRVMAVFLLLTIPVSAPIVMAVVCWREIGAFYAEQYREAWDVLTRGAA